MATVVFLDGSTKDIDGVKAFKMNQILKGHKAGTPKQLKFLENVESIRFTPKPNSRDYYPKQVQAGRLPYADD